MRPGTRILVAYATKHGSTAEVAQVVSTKLEEHGLETDVRAAGTVDTLEGYRGVVLGGALYTGRLHKDAVRFLARHHDELAALPFAVFAMGPRTVEEPDLASSRDQLDHALRREPGLEPDPVAIFGGVIDPGKLRFPFNRLVAMDARDWKAIAEFGDRVAASVAGTGKQREAGLRAAAE